MGRKRKHWVYCVVCGKLLHDHRWQACESPECKAAITLHPELMEKGRSSPEPRPGKWKLLPREDWFRAIERLGFDVPKEARVRLRTGALSLESSTMWEFPEDYSSDLRGSARPGSQKAVWGYLSRRKVYLRAYGHEGMASLVVAVQEGGSLHRAVERSLGEWGLRIARSCEIFLAWRCPCNYDHRVEYATIQDLPG